jgi:hypothetical protein
VGGANVGHLEAGDADAAGADADAEMEANEIGIGGNFVRDDETLPPTENRFVNI